MDRFELLYERSKGYDGVSLDEIIDCYNRNAVWYERQRNRQFYISQTLLMKKFENKLKERGGVEMKTKRIDVDYLPNDEAVCDCGGVLDYEGTDVGRDGTVEIYVCNRCETVHYFHEMEV